MIRSDCSVLLCNLDKASDASIPTPTQAGPFPILFEKSHAFGRNIEHRYGNAAKGIGDIFSERAIDFADKPQCEVQLTVILPAGASDTMQSGRAMHREYCAAGG